MLEDNSVNLRTLVLLQFTEKVISWSSPELFLKKISGEKTEVEKFKETVKSKMPEVEERVEIEEPRRAPVPQFLREAAKPTLRVPETRLPPQFSYLKPTATQVELELGKLNPLIADPAVNVVECNGADQQVMVRGRMGTKPTAITLTKEEIDEVIKTFSEKSKIPAEEGAVKIALGNFVLSAIISEEAGSRFIITKIPQSPPPQGIMPRR